MWGVTTQVSNPNRSTDYTTAFKNNPHTCRDAPSLLRMRVILLHTNLALDNFLTTTDQFFSAA